MPLTPLRRDRLLVGLVILAYAVIVFARGIHRASDFEEKTYYLPAYERFAERWPSLPADYYMPMPPVGLWVYGLIHRLTNGSVFGLRVANAVMACALLAVLWAHARRSLPEGRRGMWLLLVSSYPVLLSAAFLVKVNVWVLLTTTLALVTRPRPSEVRPRGAAEWTSAALMTVANLSHQMVTAVAGHGVATALAPSAEPRAARLRRAAIRLAPLLALGALFLLWGGVEPVQFRGHLSEHDVGLRLRPGQIALALALTGAWIMPWFGMTRRGVLVALVAWIPCTLLVHASGILADSSSLSARMGGATRVLVDRLSFGHAQVRLVAVGALAAAGAGMVLDGAWRAGRWRAWALLWALYVVMMNAVPYHFEPYYMLLLVPSMVLLAPEFGARGGRALLLLQVLVAAYGLAYAWLDASFVGPPR